MINLFPFVKTVGTIAALYATLAVFLAAPTGNIFAAMRGAGILEFLLLVFSFFGWRLLWSWFPPLNKWFPDLNGSWAIEIHWQGEKNSGVAKGNAVIRQSLLRISMEVHTEGSDSQTLLVLPKRDPESGTPNLYYMYRVIPKAIGRNEEGAYRGAAVLAFSEASSGKLQGNYWTSRKTLGHFILSK